MQGTAEPVTDPALVDRMGEAYAKKYWIAWLGLFKPRSARVDVRQDQGVSGDADAGGSAEAVKRES